MNVRDSRPPRHRETPLPIWLWVIALGGTGFAAGFLGPIALNPDANQGPLLGLLITGPGGAIAGAVGGVLFRLLPVENRVRTSALMVACATLGLSTLWYALPAPAVLGYLVDATVTDCTPPAALGKEALARWQAAVSRSTWYTPAADWQQRALGNLEHDPGVVLTLRVERRAAILQQRKPWNAGRTDKGPWISQAEPARYYANDEGSSCAAYLARPRQLYLPYDPSQSSPNAPARVWPPVETAGFLSLLTLGPVSGAYRHLVEQP